MTCVEHYSTARSNRPRNVLARVGWFVCASLIAFTGCAFWPTGSASSDPLSSQISSDQAEAAQLAAQIQSEGQNLEILSQRFDSQEQQVQSLDIQIARNQALVARTKSRVEGARANLRHQALVAYMEGINGAGIDSIFSSGGQEDSVAAEYRSVASGDVSSAIDALDRAEEALSEVLGGLRASRSNAEVAAD
ncbi:MAG TPA: hypothetical protein VEJ87_11035, partial [Acidimicrobiales bacterium]|nr:hypothetical protein [Acidimicrobiales bacterium]